MIAELLTELKMPGALESYLKHENKLSKQSPLLIEILQTEVDLRSNSRLERRLKRASFPFSREWCEIDEKVNSKIPFNKLKSYSKGKFMEEGKNLCFIGTPGLGKTHSLVAIGRDLCRVGYSVKFITAVELATKLEEASDELKLSKLMGSLMKPDLLIIDELGYIPLSETRSRLLFDVFSKRYEVGPIAVSTNLSLPKWIQVFGSIEMTNALIDRFTHRCNIHIFEGESFRFIESKRRVDKK